MDFQPKLNELMAEIGTLSSQTSKAVRVLTEQTHQREGDDTNTLQKSVDFLRLCIKYMLFDLEATRRENQCLRKLLEADAG